MMKSAPFHPRLLVFSFPKEDQCLQLVQSCGGEEIHVFC